MEIERWVSKILLFRREIIIEPVKEAKFFVYGWGCITVKLKKASDDLFAPVWTNCEKKGCLLQAEIFNYCTYDLKR